MHQFLKLISILVFLLNVYSLFSFEKSRLILTKNRPTLSFLAMKNKDACLDESTNWRLNINLKKENFKNVNIALKLQFVEERGYEPPQGKIFIVDDLSGVVKCNDKGFAGPWTLSEDKNDRKDGLWIWGLFEEPKYPYLYFNIGKESFKN